MPVRICTMGVPRFRLHDLEVREQWLPISTLTEKQRAALGQYHGQFVRVHPEDVTKLSELGFEFAGAKNPLRDVTAKPEPKTPSNPKTDAPKGDASGKADAKKDR
jgi:hypothetical protein